MKNTELPHEQPEKEPSGFFFEKTIKQRFLVPLDDKIREYVAGLRREEYDPEDYDDPIPTPEEVFEDYKAHPLWSLISAIEGNGFCIDDDNEQIFDHIEAVAIMVNEDVDGDGAVWGAMGIVMEGEDPSKAKTIVL